MPTDSSPEAPAAAGQRKGGQEQSNTQPWDTPENQTEREEGRTEGRQPGSRGLVRLSGGLSWDSGDKEKEGEPLRLPHLPNLGQDNQLLGTPLGHRTGGVKAVPEVDAFIRGMTKFLSPVIMEATQRTTSSSSVRPT
eukprot:gene25681-11347_t